MGISFGGKGINFGIASVHCTMHNSSIIIMRRSTLPDDTGTKFLVVRYLLNNLTLYEVFLTTGMIGIPLAAE